MYHTVIKSQDNAAGHMVQMSEGAKLCNTIIYFIFIFS